jgi:hypothetical protein
MTGWTHRSGCAAQAIALLQTSGIATLTTQDLPLALAYYAGPELRPMADIDLVVMPDARNDAFAVLADAGWCSARAQCPRASAGGSLAGTGG